MNEVLKKRYQVFVSSTYSDLIEERKHVIQALLETKCIPSGMELFPAASEDQWTLIKRIIDDCDYYVVVVAGKYGSCGPSGRSYTEMEFDYAVSRGKPVLGFFHESIDSLPGSKIERTDKTRERLESFTKKVKERICRPWTSADSLASAIKSAMLYAIENHPRPGWIRADSAPDPDFVARLKDRIAELEGKAEKTGGARFADGGTAIEFRASIQYSTWRDSKRDAWDWHRAEIPFTTTMSQVFAAIAPRLLQKRSRVGIKKMVNHWVATQMKSRMDELSTRGPRRLALDVDSGQFDTVLNTFVANKLMKRVSPPVHVRTVDFYWQLAPAGIQRLSEIRALPRDTNV